MTNSVYPDGAPRWAASHLGLHCLLRPGRPGGVGKSKVWFIISYVVIIISYIGVSKSYVGLIISYVGVSKSYVGISKSYVGVSK